MNDKQDKPKKKLLKTNYEFQPIVNVDVPKVTPYYPPRNEIVDFYSNHQLANLNEIDINYHPQQKIKKQLRPSTYKFEIAQSVDQKIQEEEEKRRQIQEENRKQEEAKRKQQEEEEERRRQEQQELLPNPYTKKRLEEMFLQMEVNNVNFKDFSYFESNQLWVALGKRKHHDHRELKKFENRKEGKIPTQKKESKVENKQFDRGTKVTQQQHDPEIKSIQIIRLVENIDQKQKKDEMKQLAESWNQKLKEAPEEEKIFQREIKYRLNQLAPDNFDQVSKIILELIIQKQDKTDFLAEKIIEKSQIEPKYRKLYTKLCGLLTTEPKLLQERPNKKPLSKFKASLLNNVQQFFQNKKTSIQKEVKPEEKEQLHIMRKNKIMGNVRFIGDLYIEGLLPYKALGMAISELVGDYIYQNDEKKNEESIEGLIELVDQIGYNLSTKSKTSVQLDDKSYQKLNSILNGSKPDQILFTDTFQELSEFLSLDLIQKTFKLLVKNYKFSQRITLLIENLQDKQKQGWQGSYVKKEEEAQSVKNLTKEQEEEDPLEIPARRGKSYQEEESIYEEKNYPAIDLNDVSVYVASSFKMESDQQEDALKKELKRIQQSKEGLQKFYDIFFQNMFSCKILDYLDKLIKKNLERAQIVYELLLLPESSEDIVKKSIQNTLNEDLVYNLCESKVAQELIADILTCFLNEMDWVALKKFYLKPDLEVEEFKDFIVRVSNNLLEKFPEQKPQELIQKYFKHLDFEINF